VARIDGPDGGESRRRREDLSDLLIDEDLDSVPGGLLGTLPWRKLAAPLITLVMIAVVASFAATLLPGGDDEGNPGGARADSGSVISTNTWVCFYGLESTLDGSPLPVGAEITAWDPQGALCGRVIVTDAGRYGLMTVYGDDPLTAADEGAVFGDWLEFRVDGVEATVIGPDEPTWTAMGDLREVDLVVTTP
jgi:hypothetical protein